MGPFGFLTKKGLTTAPRPPEASVCGWRWQGGGLRASTAVPPLDAMT